MEKNLLIHVTNRWTHSRHLPAGFLVLMLLVATAGCSFVRMAGYDPVMDQGVTDLAKTTQRFISGLETTWLRTESATTQQERDKLHETLSYDANSKFYLDFRADLHVLQLRADATPNDHITQEQLAALNQLLDEMEKEHKEGFQNAQEFTFQQKAFDRAFGAILTLEVAKKRGKA